ncbi:MAG: aspartate aminotransferase family protein, partial [Alphaproteobacteria bacterium]
DTAPLGSNSPIVAAYRARTPGSAARYRRALELFPSGLTHDTRYLKPYPLYIEHAAGAQKWDVDGNAYVDYMGGHGALLLGHTHPAVVEATKRQLDRGTHFGNGHDLELRWAELVQKLVPSAERVRFTASGTEATLLALRLARAHTGRSKIVRFATHFHGWHDHMAAAYMNHFDGSPPIGVLPSIAADVLPVRSDTPDEMRSALARDDVAAIILEPTGASWGRVPLDPAILGELRGITAARGNVLIFDEVISGFRVSPGGAQAHYGVTPDLTTLAKIGAGGLPGGILAGKKARIDFLEFEVSAQAKREKVLHFGTFNANPLSAAAAVATLEIIAGTDACARANAFGAELRAALNAVLEDEGIAWSVYGTFSGFHLFTNPKRRALRPHGFDPLKTDIYELKNSPDEVVLKLRLSLLCQGVDMNGWPGGLISAVHGPAELEHTVAAFRTSLRALKDEGELKAWM